MLFNRYRKERWYWYEWKICFLLNRISQSTRCLWLIYRKKIFLPRKLLSSVWLRWSIAAVFSVNTLADYKFLIEDLVLFVWYKNKMKNRLIGYNFIKTKTISKMIKNIDTNLINSCFKKFLFIHVKDYFEHQAEIFMKNSYYILPIRKSRLIKDQVESVKTSKKAGL